MKTLDLSTLQPGDCLLYRPRNLLDWLVCIKTGARISHVEVVVRGTSHFGAISARPRSGVSFQPIRLKNLAYVRRPVGGEFELDLTQTVHIRVGKKYDWLGLLGFFLAVRRGAKQRFFCSELATLIYREGWFQPTGKAFIPFNPGVNADHFSPADFYNAGTFETVWRDE